MTESEEYQKSLLNKNGTDDEMSLKELIATIRTYWDYLWRKKWIIVICGLLGGSLGLLYAVTKKINYTATYVFSIEGGNSSGGGLTSLLGTFGLGGSTLGAFSGDNVVELLKSRRLIEKALLSPIAIDGVERTFMEYYIEMDSLRKNCDSYEKKNDRISVCEISYPLDQKRETFTRAQDSLLLNTSATLLKENIFVAKVDKKLSFVKFSVTSSNELFSQCFSEVLLKEVSTFYIDTKTSLSRKNIELLQLQADSVRRELDNALSSRAYYADEHMNAARQIVGVQLRKREMDIQIYGTAYAEMIKNIELLKLDLARETPLIQVIDAPLLPLENDKMGKLKGLVMGGFLGGFFSCLLILGIFYIKNLEVDNQKEEELSEETHSTSLS
jgi:hypothetical protein